MKQNILFFFLNTGGGHYTTSKAIANYLESQHQGEVSCKMIDGFEKSNFLKFSIVKGYTFLQFRAKWFYELLYFFNKFKLIAKFSSYVIGIIIKGWLKSVIVKEKPDKLIIVHFFLAGVLKNIHRELNLKIPIIIVVTDPFTAPPLWFLETDIDYIVFSSQAKEIAEKNGISKERIQVFPIILDLKFQSKILSEEIALFKNKHTFSINKPLILLIGGGDGLPRSTTILKSLLPCAANVEFAVVCGKNKFLFTQCTKIATNNNKNKIIVFGFIDFVDELINIADIIITKGGPAILMEILSCKKVPIVTTYLWEQEKGNVSYIVNNRIGIYENKVPKITKISQLILETDYLNEYKKNVNDLNIPNGLQKVAAFIYSKKQNNQ